MDGGGYFLHFHICILIYHDMTPFYRGETYLIDYGMKQHFTLEVHQGTSFNKSIKHRMLFGFTALFFHHSSDSQSIHAYMGTDHRGHIRDSR